VFSFELLDTDYTNELIDNAIAHIFNPSLDQNFFDKLHFISKFYKDVSIENACDKTILFSIFAIKRFIQLAKIWDGDGILLSYDIDAVCKGFINTNEVLPITHDVGCLLVKGDRFVISLIGFRNTKIFLNNWIKKITYAFDEKKIYGFLDQDSFTELSSLYPVYKIERKFCDHTSKSRNSLVITGKGQMKHSDLFKNEQLKWVPLNLV
jgi:hypothetical protein